MLNLPVNNEALEGAHVACPAYEFFKCTPLLQRESIFGVCTNAPPPMSFTPIQLIIAILYNQNYIRKTT